MSAPVPPGCKSFLRFVGFRRRRRHATAAGRMHIVSDGRRSPGAWATRASAVSRRIPLSSRSALAGRARDLARPWRSSLSPACCRPVAFPPKVFCANVLPAVPADEGPGEYAAGDGEPPTPAATRDRLRARRPFWESCVCASLVLTWIVTGYNLQWATGPPPPFEARNARGALDDAAFVDEAVQKLLLRGAVRRVTHRPRCVSPLNVVVRRGKKRLILDLRRVNECLRRDGTGFKFEGVQDAETVLRPHDFLFKVDLEAAYHHVAMHPESWGFLGFQWRGQYYEFTVLPFGLATAPWVFTKVTRTLVGRWRTRGIRLVHYLDDFLFAVAPDADGGHCAFD